MTIIAGYTNRGFPDWWNAENSQTDSYTGAIPYEVVEQMFNWEPVDIIEPMVVDPSSGNGYVMKGKKVIANPKANTVVGVHGKSRSSANYKKTVLEFAYQLVGDDSGIVTAGQLYDGKCGWVQVALDRTYDKSGVKLMPYLAICDSNAPEYGAWKAAMGGTLIGCANAVRGFFARSEQKIRKVHRSRFPTIEEARQQLDLLDIFANKMDDELDRMLGISVSEEQFDQFLKDFHPDRVVDGKEVSAKQNRDKLKATYLSNPMVKDYAGTFFGVLQAVNTVSHHNRNGSKEKAWEANFRDNLFRNTIADKDANAKEILDRVLVG